MSIELLAIAILAIMFIVATIWPINMGALAFVGAFVLGVLVMGMSPADVFANFPGSLFLTIVGVTYMFAIAQANGTIDALVDSAVRLIGDRVWLLPWFMFLLTAAITAMGALSPAAVAIIAPIALNFARKNNINPLLMGMFVIHGAQAGGFSPIAVYGVTVNQIMAGTDLDYSPLALFASTFAFNLGIAVVLYFVLNSRKVRSSGFGYAVEKVSALRTGHLDRAGGTSTDSNRGTTTSPTSSAQPTTTVVATKQGLKVPQLVTIIGLLVVAVAALGFKVDIGFAAITVAVLLTFVSPAVQKEAVNKISWSTVLLVCGMLTFVGVLEEAGTITYVSNAVASMGMPLLAALLLLYIGAIVSAFASSTAILAALIPLAVPFLQMGELSATAVICALAISATIVDVSPFSTNGALVIANAPDTLDRDRFYKQVLIYSAIVTVIGPFIAWLVIVVPGWM